MSDLAPCVTDAPKNAAVRGSIEANETLLREKNRALNSVEITGPGGRGVFARGRLDEGESCKGRGEASWTVELSPADSLSGGDLRGAEIWIGRSHRASFADGMVGAWSDLSGVGKAVPKGTSKFGLVSCFAFRTCYVVIKSEWKAEPSNLCDAITGVSGDGVSLLRFLSMDGSNNVRHRFVGITLSVCGNKKLIATVMEQ